jgi:hypothetical protein
MLGAKKSRVPGRSRNEHDNAARAEAPGGRSGAAPQMDSPEMASHNATGVFAAGIEHLSLLWHEQLRKLEERRVHVRERYDCSGDPPSQDRNASRSLNNLWVQKSFARAPSSTLDDHERRSGERGGRGARLLRPLGMTHLTLRKSWRQWPTLQAIDMMVGHKILKRAAELIGAALAQSRWPMEERLCRKRAYQWFFLFTCVARSA